MRITLKQKAQRACGRSRTCTNCKFSIIGHWSAEICEVCAKAFNEGYVKGYKQHQKESNERENNKDA